MPTDSWGPSAVVTETREKNTANTDPGEAGETDATGVNICETEGKKFPETDANAKMDRLVDAAPVAGDRGGGE